MLYHLLVRQVGVGLAFASCLAAVPVFLSLGKSILYDSMTQFLVVASAGACVTVIQSINSDAGHSWPARSLWRLGGLGFVLGLLLLSKQSTGVGACIGVCLAIGFLPATSTWTRRGANVLIVGALTGATVCLVSLFFSDFVNSTGMLHDVFLTGAEPKGGGRRMFNNLVRYAFYISQVILVVGAAFYAISWLVRRKLAWRVQWRDLVDGLNCSINSRNVGGRVQLQFMRLVVLTGVSFLLAKYCLARFGWDATVQTAGLKLLPPVGLLNLGLIACVAVVGGVIIEGLRGTRGLLSAHALAPYAIIFFCAAVFHSLSVTVFRWANENNPLIVLALVFLLSPMLAAVAAGRHKWPVATGASLICLCLVVMWCQFARAFDMALRCTEPWPEIRQLAGARLRPECENMRELVKIVQSQANSAEHDTVLLLPNDPNVEAWFDRPRPPLSCAVLFTDQYWDRYVDRDFATLEANPPKVIVIGPRNYWFLFSKVWHWNKREGVIRLIDRVKEELIPQLYDLRFEHRIIYGSGEDFMDVYVRRN